MSVNVVEGHLSFNVSQALLTSLGFPIDDFTTDNTVKANQFVFVTAASDNHFDECLDAIVNLQQHFPQHKIFFYDLSTSRSSVRTRKVSIF
jgi:hypothetical protein